MKKTESPPRRTMQDALALLANTVRFYEEDPEGRRAVVDTERGGEVCQYQTKHGRCCAVGRWMIDPATVQGTYGQKRFSSIPVQPDTLLRPEARGFPLHFWKSLQSLHDNERNWVATGEAGEGLSYVGEEKVRMFVLWIMDCPELPLAT